MSDSWMSIIEYARQYNVSDMTVRRRIKTGRLNAELREGKYYIPISANGQLMNSSIQEDEFQIDLSLPLGNEMESKRSHSLECSIHPVHLERLAENFEIAIDQIKQREELLKANFKSELEHKDKEIEFLKKDIEDLETLVKLLEAKTT